MSRKFVRDRLNVELRDYAPGFHWAEEFATILRSCDHLELKIRKVNGSPRSGPLFLAEIETLPDSVQAGLMRFLQEHGCRPQFEISPQIFIFNRRRILMTYG